MLSVKIYSTRLQLIFRKEKPSLDVAEFALNFVHEHKSLVVKSSKTCLMQVGHDDNIEELKETVL